MQTTSEIEVLKRASIQENQTKTQHPFPRCFQILGREAALAAAAFSLHIRRYKKENVWPQSKGIFGASQRGTHGLVSERIIVLKRFVTTCNQSSPFKIIQAHGPNMSRV